MDYSENMSTAAGKISCNRCQAASKRTRQQCGRPALRGKRVCQFHGGKSTGPKTPEGIERSRQANLKSGDYTQEARIQVFADNLRLAYLEDLLSVTSETRIERTRGPKPLGYTKFSSMADLLRAIQNTKHYKISAKSRDVKNKTKEPHGPC